MADVNIINSTEELAAQSRQMFENTLDRIENNENTTLRQAANKAAALSNATSWQYVKEEVQKLAKQQGLEIDMEQAKGIYIINGDSVSAQDIVEQVKQNQENSQKVENGKNAAKEAWSAMILCTQNGVKYSASEITELLESGKAKTAKEVMETLKAQQNPYEDVNPNAVILDDERSQEIYDAFNKVFNEAGLEDKVVEALTDLCFAQQKDGNYMQGKTGEELAQEFLKNYQ